MGGRFTFCFEMDAETLCTTDPCAKPSAPHRCPGPRAGLSQLFPALSQCVSAALIASFIPFLILGGDMFLFSISCSLSWDGGSSLQPSEVSLGFFFYPPPNAFFLPPAEVRAWREGGPPLPALPASPGTRIMEMLWYPRPGLLLHLRAPRPADRELPFQCRPAGSLPGALQGWGFRCFPGGCKAPSGGREEDVMRDARGFDHPVFPSTSFSFDCPSVPSPGLLLGRSLSPRILGITCLAGSLPPSLKLHGRRTPGSVSRDGCLRGGSVPPLSP